MSLLKDFAPHPSPLLGTSRFRPDGERDGVKEQILIEFGEVIVGFVFLNELLLRLPYLGKVGVLL